MDPILPRLSALFDHFPEPVLYLFGNRMIYTNEPACLLLEDGQCPEALLSALAEHPGDVFSLALETGNYHATVSSLEGGDLLVLRPLPEVEGGEHPFSNAVYRMRDCLSNFSAVSWKLRLSLKARGLLHDFDQDLASQSRLTHQMLRLTRQAELTEELNQKSFPQEEGFDLAQVCQGMADETTYLADMAGVTFTYEANIDRLPFQGSKSLLTQMLLALISNGVRAAGRGGKTAFHLHAEDGRCVLSVQDNGVGISPERMSTLFSAASPEAVPTPGEGAGLGLYNARRIAMLHGGVLVAQSSDEGASLVVSLPVVTPPSVPLRNNPGYDNLGGYSPVLIELSDLLPWQAFSSPGDDS